MRNLTVPLILIGLLGFIGSASAAETHLAKHTAAELKAACDKAGGKFSQDETGYGCGTDCHGGVGTDCLVFCKPEQKCAAQMIGARRPRHVLDALQAPAKRAR